MTSDEIEPQLDVAPVSKSTKKRLKPARKQVKPGDVVKSETPQTGKEYSAFTASREFGTAF
jgi:exosome complex RNA-binding protein Csl4